MDPTGTDIERVAKDIGDQAKLAIMDMAVGVDNPDVSSRFVAIIEFARRALVMIEQRDETHGDVHRRYIGVH